MQRGIWAPYFSANYQGITKHCQGESFQLGSLGNCLVLLPDCDRPGRKNIYTHKRPNSDLLVAWLLLLPSLSLAMLLGSCLELPAWARAAGEAGVEAGAGAAGAALLQRGEEGDCRAPSFPFLPSEAAAPALFTTDPGVCATLPGVAADGPVTGFELVACKASKYGRVKFIYKAHLKIVEWLENRIIQ